MVLFRRLLALPGVVLFSAFYVYTFIDFPTLGHSLFHALGDELMVYWIFERVSQGILGPTPLDGQIFFPAHHSLAFAELMVLPSFLFGALRALGKDSLWTYHLSIWCLHAANFFAMYGFLKRRVEKPAAILGAFLFSFGLIRLAQANHVQLLAQFAFPLIAWSLDSFEKNRKQRYLILAAILLAAQFYSCVYLGLMAFSLLPGAVAAHWESGRKTTWNLRPWVLPLFLFAVLLSPLGAAYLGVGKTYGFERHIGEAKAFSLHFSSFLSAPKGSLYEGISSRLSDDPLMHEKHWFLGFSAILLLVLGVLFGQTRRQKWIWAGALFSVWMAFGPNGWLFQVYYYLVPGFKALRVPSRYGLVFLFFVSILAAENWEEAQKRLPFLKRAFPLLLILLAFENHVRIPLVPLPRELEGVSDFLRHSEPGPVAHLPFAEGIPPYPGDQGNPRDNREVVRMYYALTHGHPLLNGHSGFAPEHYRRLLQLEAEAPGGAALLSEIKKLGGRYLVVEKDASAGWKHFAETRVPIYEDASVSVYDLRGKS